MRAEEDHFLTNGLDSLEAVRRELEVEIFKAPTRRVDNEISRLSDSVHAPTMHCKVLREVVQRYTTTMWKWRYATIGAYTAVGLLCGTLGFSAFQPNTFRVTTASAVGKPTTRLLAYSSLGGLSVLGLLSSLKSRSMTNLSVTLTSRDCLNSVFELLYGSAIAKRNKFVSSLWASVKANLELTLTAERLQTMSLLQEKDFLTMERVLEYDVAHLRRRASTMSPVQTRLPGDIKSSFKRPSQLPSCSRQEEEDRPLGVMEKGERDAYDLMEGRSPVLLSQPSILSGSASVDSLQQDAQG